MKKCVFFFLLFCHLRKKKRCRLCCKVFSSRCSIVGHVNSHATLHSQKFTCEKCSDIFPRILDYRTHMETKHNITIPKRIFTQAETLSNPLVHHQAADAIEEVISDLGLFDMTCDVDNCITVFSSLSNAREHYLNVHTNRQGYIKCCDINCCNLKLRTPFDVKDHVAWHKDPECFKYTIFK